MLLPLPLLSLSPTRIDSVVVVGVVKLVLSRQRRMSLYAEEACLRRSLGAWSCWLSWMSKSF